MPTSSKFRRNAGFIRGLQYFETVARLGSVSVAAKELGVTQSAVSHQIKELTKVLGEKLLERSGRGISLTTTGERLAGRLSQIFADLQFSVDDIIGVERQTLRLAVCSSFAPGWLIPRLKSFIDAYPSIDLQPNLYAQFPELTDQVADAIVTALPVQPGYDAVRLIEEMLVAVHAPGVNPKAERLITTNVGAADLGQDWKDYCALINVQLQDINGGSWLRSTHYTFALEMARNGLGVALVPDFIAEPHIDARTLDLFNTAKMPSKRTYNLCFKNARSDDPTIKALTQWFKLQLITDSGGLTARS